MLNFLQNTIIYDGFISALSFFKSYISFKLNTPINVEMNNNAEKIINKAEIYNIPLIERYLMYGLTSFVFGSIYNIVSQINDKSNLYYYDHNSTIWTDYVLSFILSFPYFQNLIFNQYRINKYLYMRNLFFRYSFAKLILKYISYLNPKITGIKNYHTFIVSRYIKLDLIIDTFKTFLFIGLLHILRDNSTTYYYYKAIKLSYFYNKGYLFNVLNKEHAVNVINKLISEKKWGEISNEENSNAFYCLIIDNLSKKIQINKNIIYMVLLFFSSLWSVFCFVNLLSLHFISICIYLSICIIGTIFEIFTIKFVKKVLLSGIICFGLSYIIIINEFIITGLYFSIIYNKIPKYIINEILFFIKNYKDIEKVVEFYNKKQ